MNRREALHKLALIFMKMDAAGMAIEADEISEVLCELTPEPDPLTDLVPCGCGGKMRSYKGECGYGVYCMDCGLMTCDCTSFEEAKAQWNRSMGHADTGA